MNLFVLDYIPEQAAIYHMDSHIRSGIIESCCLLGLVYDDGKFEPWSWLRHSNRHFNHPVTIWVRDSIKNFDWCLRYAYALCNEFKYRWNKIHKCQEYLDWISFNLPIKNLPDSIQSDWPRCFGKFKDQIILSNSAVLDYRNYYMLAKRDLAKWTKRDIPEWFK